MKKIFFMMTTFLFISLFISNGLAFELYGCWKSVQKKNQDSIICFSKNSILTKQGEFNDVIYSTKEEKLIVKIPSTWATLIIHNEGDNTIFMDADMGPKKQKYIRISKEEAKILLH